MSDSSSEEEEEEWMAQHGSDHLLGVPVLARVCGALRLDRPSEVPRVREAGRRSHSPVTTLRIRDDGEKAAKRVSAPAPQSPGRRCRSRSRTAPGGREGRPPPGKLIHVGSSGRLAGSVLDVKARKANYTKEADLAEASRCHALPSPARAHRRAAGGDAELVRTSSREPGRGCSREGRKRVRSSCRPSVDGGDVSSQQASGMMSPKSAVEITPLASSKPEVQECSSPSRASTEGGGPGPSALPSSPPASASCLPGPALSADRLADMLLELIGRRIAMSESHSEREVLRKAAHVMQCAGCKDSRLHGKGCEACKGRTIKKDRRNKIDKKTRKEKDNENNNKEAKKGDESSKKSNKPTEETEAGTSSLSASEQETVVGWRKRTVSEGDCQDVEGPVGSYWSIR